MLRLDEFQHSFKQIKAMKFSLFTHYDVIKLQVAAGHDPHVKLYRKHEQSLW